MQLTSRSCYSQVFLIYHNTNMATANKWLLIFMGHCLAILSILCIVVLQKSVKFGSYHCVNKCEQKILSSMNLLDSLSRSIFSLLVLPTSSFVAVRQRQGSVRSRFSGRKSDLQCQPHEFVQKYGTAIHTSPLFPLHGSLRLRPYLVEEWRTYKVLWLFKMFWKCMTWKCKEIVYFSYERTVLWYQLRPTYARHIT